MDVFLEVIGVANQEFVGVVQKLIVLGMTCPPDVRIDVVSLSFHLARILEFAEFAQIFVESLQMVPGLGAEDLMRLMNVYEENLLDREGCPGVDPAKLAEVMLPIVNNGGLDGAIRRKAFRVLIAILSSFFAELEGTSFPAMMHEAAFNLCSALLQPDDEYELSPFDIVESIAEAFGESNGLLESVLSHLQQVQQGPNVKFYKAVFIDKSLENGLDFYYQIMEQTAAVLVPLVDEEAPCIREAAMNALKTFCELFQDESSEMIQGILGAVWKSFMKWQSSEMLVRTTNILEASGCCDSIVEVAIPFLLQMVGKGSLTDQEETLRCLAIVIKTSEVPLAPFFQPVVEVMGKIIGLEQERLSLLRGRAIYCLGRLSLKCPEQFSGIAESIAVMLAKNMASSDPYIVLECTNAYGYMLQTQRPATASTIGQVFPILVKYGSNTDSDAHFDVSLPNSVSLADCALSTLCCAVAAYPDAYASSIPEIVGMIEKNPSQLALQGIQQILHMDIPSAVGLNLGKVLVSVAATDVLPQVVGLALADIALLVASCDLGDLLGQVLDIAGKALRYDLLCQSDKSFIPDLCENAQMIFREAMNALGEHGTQFIQPYLPVFCDMISDKNKEMRNLGIQLLSDAVQNYGSVMDATLLQNVFKMACEQSDAGNYLGFNCIKNICIAIPQLAAGQSATLMPLFNKAFSTENKRRKKVRMMLDNAVSAFGAFVMNCVGAAFQIDENTVKVLELMPPTDDAEETEYVMQFYEWMLEKSGGAFGPQFTAVLVRMFSDSPDSYEQNCVSAETIGRLLPKLKQQLQSIGQPEQFCRSILNNDEQKWANLAAFLH